jgi:hypothetical protein
MRPSTCAWQQSLKAAHAQLSHAYIIAIAGIHATPQAPTHLERERQIRGEHIIPGRSPRLARGRESDGVTQPALLAALHQPPSDEDEDVGWGRQQVAVA